MTQSFYLKRYSQSKGFPVVLYLHGGPGSSAEVFERFVMEDPSYKDLKTNWIFYDQRGCGRSKHDQNVSHKKNIEDLKNILSVYSVDLVIGHSYGAYVLYDLVKQEDRKEKCLFLSISKHIDSPKYNQVLLDLITLRKEDAKKYNKIYAKLSTFGGDSWKIREELRSEITDLSERPDLTWVNNEAKLKYEKLAQRCTNHFDQKIFFNVRKSFFNFIDYSTFDFESLTCEAFYAIGRFDFLMGGATAVPNNHNIVFEASAHFPHFEEPEAFCKTIDKILGT